MNRHILLEKTCCYPEPVAFTIPAGYVYQEDRGYWINVSSGEAMMLSDNACHPMTKKEDRETGEDQKGE